MARNQLTRVLLQSYTQGWEGGNRYLSNLEAALSTLATEGKIKFSIKNKQTDSVHLCNSWWKSALVIKFTYLLREATNRSAISLPFLSRLPWIRSLVWIPDLQDLELPEMFDGKELKRRKEHRKKLSKRVCTLYFSSRHSLEVFTTNQLETHKIAGVVRFTVPPPPNESFSGEGAIPLCDTCRGSGYFYLPNQWWKHKNHLFVLRAFRQYQEMGGKLHLILSGSPQDPRSPSHRAEVLGLLSDMPYVHNLESINRSDQTILFRDARAVIQPSLYEGWSTTIEESLHFGTPIIASSIPVLLEQTLGEPDCVLFDPCDTDELVNYLFCPPESLPYEKVAERRKVRWTRFLEDLHEALLESDRLM
jgi:glycosyltransferase involved in cell wall biosynthesis